MLTSQTESPGRTNPSCVSKSCAATDWKATTANSTHVLTWITQVPNECELQVSMNDSQKRFDGKTCTSCTCNRDCGVSCNLTGSTASTVLLRSGNPVPAPANAAIHPSVVTATNQHDVEKIHHVSFAHRFRCRRVLRVDLDPNDC